MVGPVGVGAAQPAKSNTAMAEAATANLVCRFISDLLSKSP
jgi:hypothetical protein